MILPIIISIVTIYLSFTKNDAKEMQYLTDLLLIGILQECYLLVPK